MSMLIICAFLCVGHGVAGNDQKIKWSESRSAYLCFIEFLGNSFTLYTIPIWNSILVELCCFNFINRGAALLVTPIAVVLRPQWACKGFLACDEIYDCDFDVWLSTCKSHRMSKNWIPSLLFADEFGNSEKTINTAVEAIYGEAEMPATVAEGAGPEGWSLVFQTSAWEWVLHIFFQFIRAS